MSVKHYRQLPSHPDCAEKCQSGVCGNDWPCALLAATERPCACRFDSQNEELVSHECLLHANLRAELAAARAELLDTTWQDHADHWQKRAERAEAEAARLLGLVTLMQQRADAGFDAWDKGENMRAGKYLKALAGLSPGYWPDMDELRAALQEGGR